MRMSKHENNGCRDQSKYKVNAIQIRNDVVTKRIYNSMLHKRHELITKKPPWIEAKQPLFMVVLCNSICKTICDSPFFESFAI